jgi:phosphoglycerate dehydrogenase-like enzyme
MTFVFKLYFARTQEEISKVQKMIRINESFNKWLELKQNNYRLKGYFENNNYKSVAIYGMGDLGKRLFRELADDGVVVSYTIDKNIGVDDEYKMIALSERLPEVDVVIVTAVSSFDDIYLDLKGRFNGEIVSIEDVLWSV